MSRARDLSNIINSSALSVDSAFNVGVNSISPTAKLDIGGNVVVGSGGSISVSAGGTFYGDGSGLTNVPQSGVIEYALVAGISTESKGLTGTPNITVQDITAETVSIAGTLTYEDVTNIDSVGLVTARTGVEIGSPGIAATLTAVGGAVFTGIVTAPNFSGGGSQLTGITASQVGGALTGFNVESTTGSTTYYIGAQDSSSGISSDIYVNSNIVIKNNRVGIGTDNPTTTLDIDGSLSVSDDMNFNGDVTVGVGSVFKVATARHFGLVRSIGANVGDWTGIGTIGTGNGAMNAEITIWEGGSGQSSAKKFFIHDNYNVNFDSNWYEVVPLYTSGPRGGAYALDINKRELRLRRTATGYNYSAMQISIISNTGNFNAGVYTGASGIVTNTYKNTVLNQFNREVKVYGNVASAGYALTVTADVNVTGVATFTNGAHVTGDKLLVGISTGRPVGSTSSQRGLQVEGTGVESAISIVRNIDSAANPYLFLGKTRGTATGDSTIVQDGDTLGAVAWCGADGTDLQPIAAMIQGQVDGTPGVDDMPGRLVFMTTPDGSAAAVERVRISAGGTTVFTGDIDADGHTELDDLNVSGVSTFTDDVTIDGNLTLTGTAGTFVAGITSISQLLVSPGVSTFTGDVNIGLGGTTAFFDVSTGNIGIGTTTPTTKLHVIGEVTATNFNSTSDARLKTNVQVIEDPLEKIVKIDGVSFNWIEDNKPSMGVVADNIEEVLPELVSDSDPKTVNYNGLIGLLIECVKKQQVEIEELKRRIQ